MKKDKFSKAEEDDIIISVSKSIQNRVNKHSIDIEPNSDLTNKKNNSKDLINDVDQGEINEEDLIGDFDSKRQIKKHLKKSKHDSKAKIDELTKIQENDSILENEDQQSPIWKEERKNKIKKTEQTSIDDEEIIDVDDYLKNKNQEFNSTNIDKFTKQSNKEKVKDWKEEIEMKKINKKYRS